MDSLLPSRSSRWNRAWLVAFLSTQVAHWCLMLFYIPLVLRQYLKDNTSQSAPPALCQYIFDSSQFTRYWSTLLLLIGLAIYAGLAFAALRFPQKRWIGWILAAFCLSTLGSLVVILLAMEYLLPFELSL